MNLNKPAVIKKLQRKLGITLSETFFMSPVKSVTAVIGIRRDEDETH